MTDKHEVIPLYEPNSREEEAEKSLKHTQFSKGVPVFFVILLLVTILSEGFIQNGADIMAARTYQADSEQAPTRKLFRWVEFWQLGPSWQQIKSAKTFWDVWGLLPQVSKISEYETGLEDDSIVGQTLRPKAQLFLTKYLGAGNEQVFVGRDGWLYYRPEVEYLTGHGFLQPSELLRRERSGTEAVQPDSVKAILQFNEQLKKRGIKLIVMPVTCKPMTMSEMLAWPANKLSQPIQNDSYGLFERRLREHGIDVFDTTPLFWQFKTASGGGEPTHLRTDTHWTPGAMEYTANALAVHLKQNGLAGSYTPVNYLTKRIRVSGEGDIAAMLKLEDGGKSFPKQSVQLQQVLNPDGSLWYPDPASPILLMGDSYSNIYSLGTMGWGESAGFGEQLSLQMKCPVDMIVINAGGAYASRQELMKQMMRGNDRLAGKKVVIYEFAMRDLSSGDWKLFKLPEPKWAAAAQQPTQQPKPTATPQPAVSPNPSGAMAVSQTAVQKAVTSPISASTKPQAGKSNTVNKPKQGSQPTHVSGVVKAVSVSPQPGSVPYKDCLIAIELGDIKADGGTFGAKKIVVFVYGMKDNQLTSANNLKPGAHVNMQIEPWAKVEARLGGLNRVELDDADALMLDTYWGVLR